MTPANLKKFCRIVPDGDHEQPNKTVAYINDDVVMTYKDELILEIDFDTNMVITMQGSEHVGEYEMKSNRQWNNVRVFKEVTKR